MFISSPLILARIRSESLPMKGRETISDRLNPALIRPISSAVAPNWSAYIGSNQYGEGFLIHRKLH